MKERFLLSVRLTAHEVAAGDALGAGVQERVQELARVGRAYADLNADTEGDVRIRLAVEPDLLGLGKCRGVMIGRGPAQ